MFLNIEFPFVVKKWYSCIVSYSIDLAVQNAWQLHKLHTEKPMDLLAFRRHIAIYKNSTRHQILDGKVENHLVIFLDMMV